ncbi:MAG: cyclic nucleotide-binding domain-containing protein [Deltaproteobacteria bacterium]|nr:cyclic nucleotide-binding domain-containing protein [Deltaproteobacteria bacterium]
MVASALLREFQFFKGFSDAHLEKLASIATEESHFAGSQIYRKGDPANKFYLVRNGKIVMVMDSYMGPHRPPTQITVDMVAHGEVMGWSALVEPYIYTSGALCIDNTNLIILESPKLRNMLEEDFALGFKMIQAISKVIATRLAHMSIILVGERGLGTLT